jgi:DNA repair protein RecO (recombination protein O)
MKQTDKSIVLSRIPFSESSWVVKLFTLENGLQAFLFQGARKKAGNLLFPLGLIEATYYKQKESQLSKLTHVDVATNLIQLYSDQSKMSLVYFISELILKTLHENQADKNLFHFLESEIVWLNESEEISNYALWFIAQFTKFEGIQPVVATENPSFFDYKDAILTNNQPIHPNFDNDTSINCIAQSILLDKLQFLALNISRTERNTCLNFWVNYFAFQNNGVFKLKSIDIVREVLSN